MPYCPQCPGRSFKDINAFQMHWDSKHHYLECECCDHTFFTEDGLLAHQEAKHNGLRCEYCDRRFRTDEGRLAHQEATHTASMFECRPGHGHRDLATSQGREAHEGAKRNAFECRACDCDFSSEDALRQHRDAEHPSSGSRLCTSHLFVCGCCSRDFATSDALWQHEQAMHVQCSYCSVKCLTKDSKNAHEGACSFNPANHVMHATNPSPLQSGLHDAKSTGVVGESVLASALTQRAEERPASPASPCPSSDSILDEGEKFHSTSGISFTNAGGEGATVDQPCPCVHSLEPQMCSICQPTSSAPSNTDKPVGDARKNGSTKLVHIMYHCGLCLQFFKSNEEFQDHVCPQFAMMQLPYCTICYTVFEHWTFLQFHMEAAKSPCQVCSAWCCSDEMLQEHLLRHPTCSKCGKSFINYFALHAHVQSSHPVVTCWDCGGIVIETGNLGLHYTDSPAHPSCAFCGIGKRTSVDMDEHIKNMHPSSAEMGLDQPEGVNHIDARPVKEAPLAEDISPGEMWDEVMQKPLEQVDLTPSPSAVGITVDSLGELPTESSLFLSPVPPRVEHEQVDQAAVVPRITGGSEPDPLDIGRRRYAFPSPTPSEHGSDESRLQLDVSEATNINDDGGRWSPVTSVSVEPFSDLSAQSSPSPSSSSLSQSVVFISADGIPDYIRENRAIVVATSASSQSSGCTPFQLASSSSLASLDVPAPNIRSSSTHEALAPSQDIMTHRLHCRICLRDPCEDMTATICGHIFCKRCITQAVVAKSECPVCKSATLLYCLFQLDLSV